jgi:hypothetical protein
MYRCRRILRPIFARHEQMLLFTSPQYIFTHSNIQIHMNSSPLARKSDLHSGVTSVSTPFFLSFLPLTHMLCLSLTCSAFHSHALLSLTCSATLPLILILNSFLTHATPHRHGLLLVHAHNSCTKKVLFSYLIHTDLLAARGFHARNPRTHINVHSRFLIHINLSAGCGFCVQHSMHKYQHKQLFSHTHKPIMDVVSVSSTHTDTSTHTTRFSFSCT